MRKASIFMVLSAAIAMGLPYTFAQEGWVLPVSFLSGLCWVYPSNHYIKFRSTFGFWSLAILGVSGIWLGYSPTWVLTNFILLLTAWDLFHFNQTYQEYALDPINSKTAHLQFLIHLRTLALVAGLGWVLGFAALHIRTNLSFALGLALVALAILGLRHLTKLLAS